MKEEKYENLKKDTANPLDEYEGMCIGTIEKKLGIVINTEEELELRNRTRMEIKGSFYWQNMPWLTYEDAVSQRNEVSRIMERYGHSEVSSVMREKSVFASEEGISFNINRIQRDVFYLVNYKGEKQAIRVTKDNFLERYDVEA